MSSRLVYGCMSLGGSWDDAPLDAGTVDRARSAVHAALDAGITDFDHADIYAHGKSEEVFGQLLAEDPALRLRVDSVDRFMLHRPDPLADPQEVAAALDGLRKEGLVRSVGLSNMSTRQVCLYQQLLATPVTALQLELSLRHRAFVEQQVLANHPEGTEHSFPEGVLEYCATYGIEVQAWGALAGGLYTGAPIPPGDRDAAATARTVQRIAAAHGVSGEAVVLAWLMRHPGGIRPVVGTTDPRRIAASAEAEDLAPRLGHEDWYALLEAARGHPVP